MSLVDKVLPRRHRRPGGERPIWWEDTPAGPVAFDRSIRTAAEIVGSESDGVASRQAMTSEAR